MRRFKGLALRTRPLRRNGRAAMGQNPAYRAFVRTFGCGLLWLPSTTRRRGNWNNLENSKISHRMRPRRQAGYRPEVPRLRIPAPVRNRTPPGRPESHHRLGKRFWAFHGLDRVALIKQMQSLWLEESAARVVLGDAR